VWKIDLDTLNTSPDDAEFNMARRWHAAYRKAQNSNLLRKQEIKRLRADNSGFKGVLDRIGDFLEKSGNFDEYPAVGLSVESALRRQAARIQDLEDALVEQEARFQYYVQNENCESWPEARHRYPELNEKYIGIARQRLRAEGKIGPDADAKPHCWQITEERKAALKRLYGLLVIRYKYSYPDETETLRAMLMEAQS
jgi:hypothetical protein